MKRMICVVGTLGVILSALSDDNVVIICGDTPETAISSEFPFYHEATFRDRNEFWNDTYLMWELALWKGGFPNNNIHVLYADGGDWDERGYRYNPQGWLRNNTQFQDIWTIVDDAARYEDVCGIFNRLAYGEGSFPPMTEEDFLFVYTLCHGASDNFFGTINISDPSNPTEAGLLSLPYFKGDELGVDISGSYAYVIRKDRGLRIINPKFRKFFEKRKNLANFICSNGDFIHKLND